VDTNVVALKVEPRVYVLGGNASTLAFTSSLRPVSKQIVTWLVPLAWTPAGVVLGETWQRVGLAADNVAGWIDQTFPPDDERSFVTAGRELEILQRVGWHAETPERLSEGALLNPDDVPEDVLDAIGQPPVQLTQCAVCRRSCVRGDFEWNDRQLCAWDYHATVFGKRGPWRNEPYEERLFATVPKAAYVVPGLLVEAGVEPVLAVAGLPEDVMQGLVNAAIASDAAPAYLCVRTDEGLTLLRERSRPEA
jgi:hypothetical protein